MSQPIICTQGRPRRLAFLAKSCVMHIPRAHTYREGVSDLRPGGGEGSVMDDQGEPFFVTFEYVFQGPVGHPMVMLQSIAPLGHSILQRCHKPAHPAAALA